MCFTNSKSVKNSMSGLYNNVILGTTELVKFFYLFH